MVEQFRPDRLIGRARRAALFPRLDARAVIICDLLAPFEKGFARLLVEIIGCIAGIIGKRFHLFVKERQPVLHARITLAGAYRAVKRIIRRVAAKRRRIIAAEAADGLLIEQRLAHGDQRDGLEIAGCALGFGVERPDGLELRPEEVEA